LPIPAQPARHEAAILKTTRKEFFIAATITQIETPRADGLVHGISTGVIGCTW
jgi:hypothetical protein